MRAVSAFALLASALLSASSSFAAQRFDCAAKDDGFFGINQVIVTVDRDVLTVSYDMDGSESKGICDLDRSYHPRSGGDVVKFDCARRSLADESGEYSVIASKSLLSKSASGGFVRLRWRGEGFYNSLFACRRAN